MQLGIQGTRFTRDGVPAFLYGISYYGALGASDAALQSDLDEIQCHGLGWLRVWATWAAFGNDVSAVAAEDGAPREPFLSRLRDLVAECDRRGLAVDVTLSRGNGVTGPPRLQSAAAHSRAVEVLQDALGDYGNWYLDLSNERNITDRRFTDFASLADLRRRVRQRDADRLVTASHAGDIPREDLRAYVQDVGVDFIAPHRPRWAGSPAETETRTREYLALMQEWGRALPVHYQEPFRRGFGDWQPLADDYATDLRGAMAAGAAGWCLHNGHGEADAEGRPRRSFDLREGPLFSQLDDEERKALARKERNARDPEILNRRADDLNKETADVLDHQVPL